MESMAVTKNEEVRPTIQDNTITGTTASHGGNGIKQDQPKDTVTEGPALGVFAAVQEAVEKLVTKTPATLDSATDDEHKSQSENLSSDGEWSADGKIHDGSSNGRIDDGSSSGKIDDGSSDGGTNEWSSDGRIHDDSSDGEIRRGNDSSDGEIVDSHSNSVLYTMVDSISDNEWVHEWSKYHGMSLDQLDQSLHHAANCIFPSEEATKRNIYALIICWETEKNESVLVAVADLRDLERTFRYTCRYNTYTFKIPKKDPSEALLPRLEQFIQAGGNNPRDLKIIYYAGYARYVSHTRAGRDGSVWTTNGERGIFQGVDRMCDSQTEVEVWEVQRTLRRCQSDLLYLLDCEQVDIDLQYRQPDRRSALEYITSMDPHSLERKKYEGRYYTFTRAVSSALFKLCGLWRRRAEGIPIITLPMLILEIENRLARRGIRMEYKMTTKDPQASGRTIQLQPSDVPERKSWRAFWVTKELVNKLFRYTQKLLVNVKINHPVTSRPSLLKGFPTLAGLVQIEGVYARDDDRTMISLVMPEMFFQYMPSKGALFQIATVLSDNLLSSKDFMSTSHHRCDRAEQSSIFRPKTKEDTRHIELEREIAQLQIQLVHHRNMFYKLNKALESINQDLSSDDNFSSSSSSSSSSSDDDCTYSTRSESSEDKSRHTPWRQIHDKVKLPDLLRTWFVEQQSEGNQIGQPDIAINPTTMKTKVSEWHSQLTPADIDLWRSLATWSVFSIRAITNRHGLIDTPHLQAWLSWLAHYERGCRGCDRFLRQPEPSVLKYHPYSRELPLVADLREWTYENQFPWTPPADGITCTIHPAHLRYKLQMCETDHLRGHITSAADDALLRCLVHWLDEDFIFPASNQPDAGHLDIPADALHSWLDAYQSYHDNSFLTRPDEEDESD